MGREVEEELRTDRGKRLRGVGDVPPYEKLDFTYPSFDHTRSWQDVKYPLKRNTCNDLL